MRSTATRTLAMLGALLQFSIHDSSSVLVAAETSENKEAAYSNLLSSRQQLRGGGGGEASLTTNNDRSLFWSNDANVTDAATAAAGEECAELLDVSDTNGDGVVDWKEYVGFVQLLSVDTEHRDKAGNITSYFDMPLELQMTYNRLACYYCFNNSTQNESATTTSLRAALAPETTPPARDECCIGLDTFQNSSVNGTVDVVSMLEEEEMVYLTRMCDATVLAMDEAWEEVEGRLTVCPAEFNPGADCSAYEAGLQCGYGHIYMGCTWDELFCQYIERCDCYDNTWSCLSLSIMPCGFDGQPVPEGLPWGQPCDPEEPLPSPPEITMIQGGRIP